MTVPMELSEIEMRAFYKVLTGLKVRRIALVEKGVADAVGIGMPVLAQTGSMVVNIGASTTGISVISDGKVIIGRQYPYGGNAMDQAVITMVRREHNLAIGKKTAEKLRVAMGYLMNGEAKSSEVYGIHTISGVPSSARIPSEDISKAITDTADAIADAVKMTLQRTPPQLLENIQQNGIYLAGGVSLTPNIASYIQEKVTFPVYNVPDPVYNTMNGLVEIMNDKELKKLTFSLKDYVGNLYKRGNAMKKKMNDSGKSKLVLTILTAVCVVLIILSFTTDASIRATSLCHRSDHADPEWNERNRHMDLGQGRIPVPYNRSAK